MAEKKDKVITWTKEQSEAIETTGKNLLVSASAGSGKTTVMIQRIIHLMQKENLPVSSFLVVTFTKASASDMKQKLIEKLSKLEQTENIAKQIEMVETSDISNLHSFCSRLVQSYFYEVDVDPVFHIIDGTDSAFLKQKAAEKLFEKKEKSGDEDYFALFEIFQQKRGYSKFKEIIFKFNDYLNSNIDGKKWFEDCLKIAHNENINENICAKIINNSVATRVQEEVENVNNFAKLCLDFDCEVYYNYFVDMATSLSAINHNNSYLSNAKNLFELKIEKRPTLKGFEELKTMAEGFVKDLKGKINNFKVNYISCDESVLKNQISQSKKHLEALFNLTLEFNEIYTKIKKEVNGLDFHDLEMLAIKILNNPSIQDAVRRKYAYVFVDEYQDINAVQEEIISKISSEKNRFMVGDIKQSIYAFRLCDPEIFLQKQTEYAGADDGNKLVLLNCNFRSDKKILKFVDMVFSGVMTEKFGGVDYAKDSVFEPGPDNYDCENSLNLCYIDIEREKAEKKDMDGVYSVQNHIEDETEDIETSIAEANYVYGKIIELTDQRNPNAMNYSDIAILVQSRNKNIKKFIETLKNLGIPVSSDEKIDLMAEQYIQEIVDFVKFSVSSKDDILLFRVLKSRLFGFSNEDLVALRKLNHSDRFFNSTTYINLINDEKLKEKVQKFNEKCDKFRILARVLNLKDFIKTVIDDFSLIQINYASEKGGAVVENIEKFIELIPDVTCSNFVIEYADLKLEIENESGDDSVTVMSIHKSKGIEFRAVFLVNTKNAFNFQSTYGDILFDKNIGAALSYFDVSTRVKNDTIPISAVRLLTKRKLVEEDQRLLYVALTRAKEKMFIVCSKKKSELLSDFPKNPGSFNAWFERFIFDELSGKHCDIVNFEEYHIDDLMIKTQANPKSLLLSGGEEIKKTPFVYGNITSTTIPQKNSVSRILKMNDENDDYENSVLSEELLKSSAARGTAYHKVFENIDFKNMHNIEKQLCIIKENILQDNEKDLIEDEKVLAVVNNDLFKNISSDAIILKEREFYAKMPVSLLKQSGDDCFIMQGVIDLIIFDKNETIVLDYKTGSFSDEKLERYKFQLNTYANIVERAYKKPVTQKFIYFVDLQKIIKI